MLLSDYVSKCLMSVLVENAIRVALMTVRTRMKIDWYAWLQPYEVHTSGNSARQKKPRLALAK